MAELSGLQQIDALSGSGFEQFIVELLQKLRFSADIVGGSNDKGVDIVAGKDGVRFAVQCKRYAANVSRTAVSDCVAGMRLYRCDRSMLITNSGFQQGAIELAAANDTILVGRPMLIAWITDGKTSLDTFTDIAETVRELDIDARILSAELEPRREASKVEIPGGQLTVRVQLINSSTNKKYNFRSWSLPSGLFGQASPEVRQVLRTVGLADAEMKDEFGNDYCVIGPAFGGIREQSIYPGKTVYDCVVFEPPVMSAQFLYLTLPCANFVAGSKQALRLRCPTMAISRPALGSSDRASGDELMRT
jgi:restriction system protein